MGQSITVQNRVDPVSGITVLSHQLQDRGEVLGTFKAVKLQLRADPLAR